MKASLLYILILTALLDCRQSGSYNSNLNEKMFHRGERLGSISSGDLKEISGIEASSVNPGMLWTHNDSGNDAEIFLINQEGDILMKVDVNGVKNKDWEDIALVNSDSGSFLYIGDIGDNLGRRKKLFIHKIKEPKFNGQAEIEIDKDVIETMTITYENGARDAETLLADPNSGELIIITKREEKCFVYSFPFQKSKDKIEVKPAGNIFLTELTGGDINDAGEILIKSYKQIFYWSPSGRSTIKRIINGPDYRIPYKEEPQGEAICWNGEGDFFTLSEFHQFSKQYIYFYERTD